MAYYPSDRELPAIVVEHPMQMISDEEIGARALQIVEEAIKLLDGD